MCFHTRHDRYTFLQNRCTVYSAIFDSLVVIYSIDRNARRSFLFYPIKETVNIVYVFMINSFHQIVTLFLPKGINQSELNETNWANFIHL